MIEQDASGPFVMRSLISVAVLLTGDLFFRVVVWHGVAGALGSALHPETLIATVLYKQYPIFVLCMMFVLLLCNLQSLRILNRPAPGAKVRHFPSLIHALAGGAVVAIISWPLLSNLSSRVFVNTIVPKIHPIPGESIGYLLICCVALPLVSQLLFCGLVFRSFALRLPKAAAISATAVLYAVTWPIYGGVFGLLLSVAACAIHARTRQLSASVTSSIVASVIATAIVLNRIWG